MNLFHRLIASRAPATLLLSVTSIALSYLLAIPIGLWATVRNGTLRERAVSTLLYMLYSLPAFVAALYLQLLFFSKLGWLPLFGMKGDIYDSLSAAGKAWDLLKHAILPITCFTYGSLAYYSRFVHANMEEVIRQDYIRTARAKGVPPFQSHLASRLSQHTHSAGYAARPDVAELARRRGDPRANLRLARHGPAVLSKQSANATTTRSWASRSCSAF